TSTEIIPNRFQFVGEWGVTHEQEQVDRMGARSYFAQLGRFGAQDPLNVVGPQPNLYRYAENAPVNLIDPEGLFSFSLTGLLNAVLSKLLGPDPAATVTVASNISTTVSRGVSVLARPALLHEKFVRERVYEPQDLKAGIRAAQDATRGRGQSNGVTGTYK